MSKMATVTQIAAHLLDGKSEPAKIKDAIEQVQARKREAWARYEDIRVAPMSGRERVRITREGSPRELVELNQELELLEAEMTQFDATEGELHQEHDRALVRSYPDAARKSARAIPKTMDRLEAAEAALAKAKAEVHDRMSDIARAAKHCPSEAPFLDDATFERVWVGYLKRCPVPTGSDSRVNARLRHGLPDDAPQPVRGKFPGKPEAEPFERDERQSTKSGRRPPSEYWQRNDDPPSAA